MDPYSLLKFQMWATLIMGFLMFGAGLCAGAAWL